MKNFSKLILLSIAGFGIASQSGQAIAAEETTQTGELAQVNSVFQLRDVAPGDWAFDALRNLVERYNCLVGYPDGTFRGDRPISRYEFATGLDFCMWRMEGGSIFPDTSDIPLLRRLVEDFEVELATLNTQVDQLETRVDFLEDHAFSTTTKLKGEVVFSLSDVFGGENITGFGGFPATFDGNTTFQDRVRLSLETSFSGKDLLTTRLRAGNAVPMLAQSGSIGGANILASNEGRLAIDNSTLADNNNSVAIDLLSYQFPVGDRTNVSLFADGGLHYHYANTFNPYLDDQDGGNGALSRFGQRNPIYNLGGGGAGLGLNFRLSDALQLDAGYLANRSADAGTDGGLFNGNYSALAQLAFTPGDRLKLGLTYIHAYDDASQFRFGSAGEATGTFLANLIPGSQSTLAARPISSNSYGIEASYALSPRFVVSGWAGLTHARLQEFGDAQIWNYAVALSLPDLGKEGNIASLIVGVEPTLKGLKIADNFVSVPNDDSAFHIEASYKHQFTDNIAITPGVIWLPSLNQNSGNDDVFIGTIRTTFNF